MVGVVRLGAPERRILIRFFVFQALPRTALRGTVPVLHVHLDHGVLRHRTRHRQQRGAYPPAFGVRWRRLQVLREMCP